MHAVVVGAGVVGLTVSIRLADAGHTVAVFARDLPLETTSGVAAALWYPYLAFPHDRVGGWAKASYEQFARLASDEPGSGVRMLRGTELLRQPTPDPEWVGTVDRLQRVSDPPAGYRDGWSFIAPVVDMSVYLPWLRDRLERAGGTLTRLAVPALPDRPDVVVNCSGLASRHLCADTSMFPVRGQVLYVRQWGLSHWWLDEDGPTYVIPRLHEVVVGGTEQEGDWDTQPHPDVAAEILRRATAMVPELAKVNVLRHRVGLRPARPAVRLEAVERPGGRRLVHCYGHGGAGVTLSWGCADEVLSLAG